MSASRVRKDVPRWPLWMAPVAVIGTWAAGWVAGIAVVVSVAVRGGDRIDAPALLLLVALTAALGTWIVVLLAGRVSRPTRAALGLRAMPIRRGAAGVAVALALVAVAALAAEALGGALGGLPVPPELSEQIRLFRLLGDPDPTVVDLDAAAGCSILARALIGPLFGELLLRGFVLPILARRWGDGAAVAVLAPLTALTFAGAGGEPWLLLPGLALGVALCLLYLETGSILPGAVVSATWSSFVLGLAFRWGAGDAFLLALLTGALAAGAGLLASGGGLQSKVTWRSPSESRPTWPPR
jgi:membrane protease YdiL (CAAX protease family)